MVAALLAVAACSVVSTRPESASTGTVGRQEPPPISTTVATAASSSSPTAAPPTSATAAGYASAEVEPDDGVVADPESPGMSAPAAAPAPHPFDEWSEERLAQAAREQPESLGSLSIGTPNAGRLFNGVAMPTDPLWELVDPPHAWGTHETVEYLERAIRAVDAQHPGSPRLRIGHISARHGGPLSPHVSHQSGRDVDVSYYYVGGAHRWYARANSRNLDRERTWTFVRALLTETDVELVLIDQSIQRLLREQALTVGEERDWVKGIFEGEAGGRRAIIRHARGHDTHIHIRFYNPIAQESARRVVPLLVEAGHLAPCPQYVHHRVRKGETLGKLARRYGTTVREIKRANQLRSNLIRAGRVYRIPRPPGQQARPAPVVVPARRLPPTP